MVMAKRIVYIDIAKALCIILVVIGHYCPDGCPDWWIAVHDFIYTFHMPLFMFLSGLVACSGVVVPYWGIVKLGKKLKGLLIPMLVFGMSFTMTYAKDFYSGLIGFIESPVKNGYWYLMTLAVFYVSLSLYRLNVKQKWYVDVALAISLWGGTPYYGNIQHRRKITSVC